MMAFIFKESTCTKCGAKVLLSDDQILKIENAFGQGVSRCGLYCYKCCLKTEHTIRNQIMSHETLNPELNGMTPTNEWASLSDLMAVALPALMETKEELFGLSELRARVELAKVFVVHTKEGIVFEKTSFEAVWAAVAGTENPENGANSGENS